jgi:hypothetical protein
MIKETKNMKRCNDMTFVEIIGQGIIVKFSQVSFYYFIYSNRMYLFLYLFIYLFIYLFMYLYLSIYLSIYY